MSAAPSAPSPLALDTSALKGELRFLLRRVPWWTYMTLRDALDSDAAGVRMTYLEGALELMTPLPEHEEPKKLIARLLETWATELDVDLRGFGNTTFRAETKRGGLEPDESYTLGPLSEGEVPRIAIEVEVTRPFLDKLEVYARLGVPEVWVWRDGRIIIHCATPSGGYSEEPTSRILPELDVAELASFVRLGESHTKLTRAYRDVLRRSAT